jgi:hypothetical protein
MLKFHPSCRDDCKRLIISFQENFDRLHWIPSAIMMTVQLSRQKHDLYKKWWQPSQLVGFTPLSDCLVWLIRLMEPQRMELRWALLTKFIKWTCPVKSCGESAQKSKGVGAANMIPGLQYKTKTDGHSNQNWSTLTFSLQSSRTSGWR